MNRTDLVHPTAEQLADFRLGRIDPPLNEEIETHVAECDSCCQTLASLPDDSFVGLCRASTAAEDVVPAVETQPAAATLPAERVHCDIPPALVDHPRYRILDLIGAGGMGAVYRAQHLLMERQVALKVVNRNLVDQPKAVERFRREVKSAARLSHPNIVTAFDAEQASDTHFLVMEFVPGITLSEVVRREGRLAVSQAAEYARQAAVALQYAHENCMVHRDIKPQNLMLTPSGQIKVLDFGLASHVLDCACAESEREGESDPGRTIPERLARSLTHSGAVLGTPDYIAPEQVDRPRCADIRADIYSLGCTLYYLLAGHEPFSAPTVLGKLRAHQSELARPLHELRPDIPAGLSGLVERMMAKEPSARPQTPAEVAGELVLFVTPGSAASVPVLPPNRRIDPSQRTDREYKSPWRGRRFVVALAGTLTVLAVAGILWWHQFYRDGLLEIQVDDPASELYAVENGLIVVDKLSGQGRGGYRPFQRYPLPPGTYWISPPSDTGPQPYRAFTIEPGKLTTVTFRLDSAGQVGVHRPHPRGAVELNGKAGGTSTFENYSSLAVLPFLNESGKADLDYLQEALALDVSRRLRRSGILSQPAESVLLRKWRQEVMDRPGRRSNGDVHLLGRGLGVDMVLTGRFRLDGEIKLEIELFNVSIRTPFKIGAYSCPPAEVVQLSARIALDVARECRPGLTAKDEGSIRGGALTTLPPAWKCYWLGRAERSKGSHANLHKALSFFEDALKSDGIFPEAQISLGDCCLMLASDGLLPPREAYPRARRASQLSLKMEDTSDSVALLAAVRFQYEWNWTEAENSFIRSIQLDAKNITARQRFSFFLSAMGRHDHALAEIDKALALDPESPELHWAKVALTLNAGKATEAVAQAGALVGAGKSNPSAQLILSRVYLAAGMNDQAVKAAREAHRLGAAPTYLATLASVLAHAGHKEEAETALKELLRRAENEYVSPYLLGIIYAGLGQRESALDYLEQAREARDPFLVFLRIDWETSRLRSHPRFKALVDGMRFPP